jgi:hypothetical protein
VAAAYQADRPIATVKGTGGVADEWGGRRYIDQRRTGMVLEGSSPEDAVKKVMHELSRRGNASGRTRATKRASERAPPA